MKVHASCVAAAAALAVFAAAGSASAQDTSVAFNAAVTTDYVFRGISQTNQDPALQIGADATIGSLYIGGWASNVDFGDSTDAEIDLYGGYRTEVSGFAVDVGAIAYLYADVPVNRTYNYVEAKVAVSRAVGPITAGAAVFYSPNFFGGDEQATYIEANAAYAVNDKLTITGAVGEQFLDETDDYLTYNIGAAYLVTSNVVADVRYYDTDYDTGGIVNDRVVGTLKLLF
ncbi:hypothetical protein BZG35_15630 [Brevundimonas sp. LM2]|uniref:TorF family putative porin n=1 Tax=Brevundimonas sp. LM2 TaxID=1938605 RepID=UPI000983B50A|nr:TorF family putative porin [Brevundimonas sp. LM2]AQR62924.1 hypothetical protein BZG35_15630 [Brevundimonas sp. LM2]